jgi:hypothetical protein
MDLVDEIAGALGRSPYTRDNVNVSALEQILSGIERGTVSSAMHPEGLQYLLSEGVAPNAFATGATGAARGGGASTFLSDRELMRRIGERSLFDTAREAPASARPHYGFMQGPEGFSLPANPSLLRDSAALEYGPIIARWSDDVRDAATYTIGDSLNQFISGSGFRSIPRPLSETSLQDFILAGGAYAGRRSHPYAEVQMFGGPRLDQLAGLSVSPGSADQVASMLSRYGVDVPFRTMPFD